MKRMISLSVVGLIAGTVFGLFLKVIEQLTGKKVYVLLLNVDYFPVLKYLELNEGIEFSFHLVVSVAVTIVLYEILKRFNHHQQMGYYVLFNSLIAVILYPTTSFSNRTPALFDGEALIYWLVGHALFGILIGWQIKAMIIKKHGR